MGAAHLNGHPRDHRVLPTKRFLWLPLAAGTGAIIVYTFLFGDTGYLRERALRGEMSALQREIRELEREGAALREVLAGLHAGQIERVGRERLGLIRPGEVTYRLVPMERDGWSLDKGDTIR